MDILERHKKIRLSIEIHFFELDDMDILQQNWTGMCWVHLKPLCQWSSATTHSASNCD
jgi:hypothetical protein